MVADPRYVPDRGDVVWLTLSPQVGHEQAGRRPTLVLSPAAYNGRVGLALICPLTTQVKGYPFEVTVPPGLPARGVILADQMRSQDWRGRHAEFMCRLPDGAVNEVLETVRALL